MKKFLTIALSSLLLLGLAVNVFADSNLDSPYPWVDIEELAPDAIANGMFGDTYPYSVDYDWPECKSDPIIKGTVITGVDADGTTHCWSNGTNNASCAFDGDNQTFFDPYDAHERSWAGLRLDQAYELTEVRICSRSGFDDRIVGARIEGSNDNGVTWHNVVYFDPDKLPSSGILTNDYHIITPEKNDDYINQYKDNFGMDDDMADLSKFWVGHGSYSMYRYVNYGVKHGDCAEIELYGHPADAYVGDEVEIYVAPKSDLENYYGTVEYTGIAAAVTDGSIPGTVIIGGSAYSDSATGDKAFDGDGESYYDPAEKSQECWTGIIADKAYVLNEVRILPRIGQFVRTEGATIQGSNDGATWTTLVTYTADDCLADGSDQTWVSKTIENAGAYWMFRYITDGTQHGDVGEVAFYGTAGDAELKWEIPAAPAVDMLKCDGNEYDDAASAAKALGTKPIMNYEFIDGATIHFGNEGPENLWDDDVTTKFCTDGFPAWSVAQVEEKYAINGIIMATANDNSSNPGRAPGYWEISGSNDGDTWEVIAAGDDTFFTEVSGDVDFTYFAGSIAPSAAYSMFKFECTGTPINLMQVSEVVLCSADAPEAAAAEPEPEPAAEEPKAEEPAPAEEPKTEEPAPAEEPAAEEPAAEAPAETPKTEEKKSGCGSFIGGGLIVLVTVLGSAWISRRK